jgi:hypothetical protein
MFGIRTGVMATAVAALLPVRAGPANSRAAAVPRGILGAAKGLNAALGRTL